MTAALSYTDAQANVLDLNDFDMFMVLTLSGAGMPGIEHHTQRTPLQDGETHIRTLLAPRFLIVELAIMAASFEALQAARRILVAALNPKLGAGMLTYKPDPAGAEYGIDCFVEQGVEFSNLVSPASEVATVSFRCPDPAWYNTTQVLTDIVAPDGGLEFPTTLPIIFSGNSASAVINNTGDLESWPVVSLAGPFTGFQITNATAGKTISLPGLSVASAETLAIDMKQKTIMVGGISVFSYLTADSEFWSLRPGNNTVLVRIPLKDAVVTVNVDWYVRYLGV